MSRTGHERLGGASCRSSHVRNAPSATVGPKKAACRDGPTNAPQQTASFNHVNGARQQFSGASFSGVSSRWTLLARRQFSFGVAVVIFCIASLMEKLAALARGGNSLKLSSHFATNACAGTNMNIRCADQSP
jgi:hypothetical protein